MPYSIVHFVETDEVEIIPINWLSASKNKCWWPPYKSSERQSKAVMNGDTPNQQVWLSFDVKVLGGGKIFGESFLLHTLIKLFIRKKNAVYLFVKVLIIKQKIMLEKHWKKLIRNLRATWK